VLGTGDGRLALGTGGRSTTGPGSASRASSWGADEVLALPQVDQLAAGPAGPVWPAGPSAAAYTAGHAATAPPPASEAGSAVTNGGGPASGGGSSGWQLSAAASEASSMAPSLALRVAQYVLGEGAGCPPPGGQGEEEGGDGAGGCVTSAGRLTSTASRQQQQLRDRSASAGPSAGGRGGGGPASSPHGPPRTAAGSLPHQGAPGMAGAGGSPFRRPASPLLDAAPTRPPPLGTHWPASHEAGTPPPGAAEAPAGRRSSLGRRGPVPPNPGPDDPGKPATQVLRETPAAECRRRRTGGGVSTGGE
jgi:hypothetical protein